MRRSLTLTLVGGLALSAALAQHEQHGPIEVHGVPGGVPEFCPDPNAVSIKNGTWSDPQTWAGGRVPGSADRVSIVVNHEVTYDIVSDARLACVEVHGHLRFRPDANTRMNIGNIMVPAEGWLEVGSVEKPVAAGAQAEIVIADEAIDRRADPAELGRGIESMGRITMHGSPKEPVFTRLAKEPLAGATTLVLEQAPAGWNVGDRIVIPDTRQLRDSERGSNYKPRAEKIGIAAISGTEVTLVSPLEHDHKGARNADGKLEFLPHIGNLSRNVIVRSENPSGIRGHMIFMARASVDLRFVEVREMGRTRMGLLDNADFDDTGKVTKLGTNQVGRYGIHLHHYFGPVQPPADGYQFTLIGNSVDGAPKWGITVHNSHYGLIQDNIVYNTRGAGIVTEDGTESFNVFEHNFAMNSRGSGEFAPVSGYSGAGPDPGGEGSAFWFRGPNNYIRNNVAANADVFGFDLAAGTLGDIRIPAFHGADTSNESGTRLVDSTAMPVLEFVNNESYGSLQTGAAIGWNADIRGFRAWHTSRHGLTAMPADKLSLDSLIVRGDKSILADEFENPAGVWVGNYVSKTVLVRNADVEGMRTGVASPFFRQDQKPEPGRGEGVLTIEDSRFRDYIGVVVATAYRSISNNDKPVKRAIVRSSLFELLPIAPLTGFPPAAVSMNYRMASGDANPRDPVFIYDFNRTAGDNFALYYSLEAPKTTAPCNETRPGLDGWVCSSVR